MLRTTSSRVSQHVRPYSLFMSSDVAKVVEPTFGLLYIIVYERYGGYVLWSGYVPRSKWWLRSVLEGRSRDAVEIKLRKFLKRSLELFDMSLLSSVEGMKRVAEKDNFEFPVDAIIGHSIAPEGGIGAAAEQLPGDFQRGSMPKTKFQFLVRWTGYDQPTFIGYKAASRLPHLPGYVVLYPGLAML